MLNLNGAFDRIEQSQKTMEEILEVLKRIEQLLEDTRGVDTRARMR